MYGPHLHIGTPLSKEKSLGTTLPQEYRLFFYLKSPD